jgi:Abortive infection alpha
MGTDEQDKPSLPDKAFGTAAEEFSNSAQGAGAVVGLAAKEGATALLTVTQALNALISPLKLLIVAEQVVREKFLPLVGERVRHIPEERRIAPPVMIAGPTIEAAKFVTDEPDLAAMFANLLTTAMDKETAGSAHPAFIEILKQLSADEARILRYFSAEPHRNYPVIDVNANRKHGGGFRILSSNFSLIGVNAKIARISMTAVYLENLCRLGLCAMPVGSSINSEAEYLPLETDAKLLKYKTEFEAKNQDRLVEFNRKVLHITVYGHQFLDACVVERKSPA